MQYRTKWLDSLLLGLLLGVMTIEVSAAGAEVSEAVRDEMQRLHSTSVSERVAAAGRLGDFGQAASPAVPLLVGLLSDETPDGTECYTFTQDRVACPTPALMAQLSLQQIGIPAFAALQRAAGDPAGKVRDRALRAMTYISEPRSAKSLLAALQDVDVEVRRFAARSIKSIDGAMLQPFIEAMLHDPDATVRAACARQLARFSEPKVVPALSAALRDDDEGVRANAVVALGEMNRPGAAEVLVAVLEDAAYDSNMRSYAAAGLGSLGARIGFEPLLRAAAGPYVQIRLQAIPALGRSGDARAVPVLLRALRAESFFEREVAAYALGSIGDPSALGDLRRLLDDSSPIVRRAVTSVIQTLEAKQK